MERLSRIREKMQAEGLDVLYIRNTSNIMWATGFEGVFDTEPAHALIVTGEAALLHSDTRYSAALRACAKDTPFEIDDSRATHFSFVKELVGEGARVGVEDTLTLAEYRTFETEVEICSRFIEGLREVKDEAELERMRGAQAITDAAFTRILEFIRPGLTEREVQLRLDNIMFELGAEALAFPTIVACGPHAASPHAIPGETKLEQGHAVVMDFGAVHRGYTSDMTRTVFLGEPSAELTKAWQCLRRANEECEAMVREGITGAEVHEHAENVLAQGGYAGKMGHGLGHSLGIDVHEDPSLAPRNKQPLCAGNVLTVEPGIYVEGAFGMRLEDFGVVTHDGYEVITNSTHEMVII